MTGKGSKVRPMKIDKAQFEDNWDRIFGGKKEDEVPVTNTGSENPNIHDVWNFAKQHGHLHVDGYRKDAFECVAWWIDEYKKSIS